MSFSHLRLTMAPQSLSQAHWHPLHAYMPPTGISALPRTLLEQIIEDVATSESRRDILKLRCANKAFCRLATPVAFWEIVIHTTDKSTQNFLELLLRPDVTEHVRDIQIIEDPVPFNLGDDKDEDNRYKRVGNSLRTACFMLHLIPTLESIIITFLPRDDTGVNPFKYDDCFSRYERFQLDVLEGLAHNPNPLPALQSLHINSWFAFRHELYTAAPFKRIVASLQDLCFIVQDTKLKGTHDHGPAVDFWKDVIGPRVLQPAVNLTSLAMESSVKFGLLSRLDLNSVTFPSLTELSLTNFVWDNGINNPQKVIPGAEDFIVRHGKILKRLELHNCRIHVPHESSIPAKIPVRSWAAVWDRFAKELTELVNLVVVYDFQLRYVYICWESGFEFRSTSFPGDSKEDTPALEALLTAVITRRASNPPQTENLWWCQ